MSKTPKISDIKIVEKDWMPDGKFALIPPNTESDKSIDEIVRVFEDNGWHENNSSRSECSHCIGLGFAKAQIHQLVAEARIKGEVDIYSWIISSYEDGEDIENIVSESKTRLSQLTNGEKK